MFNARIPICEFDIHPPRLIELSVAHSTVTECRILVRTSSLGRTVRAPRSIPRRQQENQHALRNIQQNRTKGSVCRD